MNRLLSIDVWLIAQTRRLTDWWQGLTGLNSFWCARQSLRLYVAAILGDLFNYWRQIFVYPTHGWELFTCAGLLLFWGVVDLALARLIDRDDWTILPSWLPAVRSLPWMRLVNVGLAVVMLVVAVPHEVARRHIPDAINAALCVPGFAAFYYFIEINPRPRGTSRLREWIRKLTTMPRLIPVRTQR